LVAVTDYPGFETRYAIRLPNGKLAFCDITSSPWIWDSRELAEKSIGYFKHNAEKIGVSQWEGEIVRQLCTPWIGEKDNADHLITELSAWLARETGGRE
jgi:hypothetical protein